MATDVETIQLGSGYPLQVGAQGGLAATVIKVVGGGTIYYGPDNTVSSSSNTGNVTNGNSLTITSPTWIISATSSQVSLTNYPGGGDIESLYSAWLPIYQMQQVPMAGGVAAGQYLATGTLNTFVAVAGTATGQAMFYLDPATLTGGVGVRTPKIRLRANITTNAVAPASTSFVYALLPVATVGGASGAVPTVATVGTATVSATILTPLATTQTVGTSASAAFPAAGWFALAVTVGTGGTAANANTLHGFELQVQRTAP